MKTRILIPAGLFLTILSGLTTAAPAPPSGRPKELVSFQAHRFNVQDLAFSPDGQTLSSAGRDSTVKLWEVSGWKKLAEIQAHPSVPNGPLGIVFRVAFTPDGKTVASCGDDRKVKFWDVATGNSTDTLDGMAPPLLFSPDGNRLAAGHLLWDLKTNQFRNVWKGLTDRVELTRFDDKGKLWLFTATGRPKPPTFTLWDVDAGKEVITFRGHTKEVCGLACTHDGKTIASSGWDHTVRLWDAATGKNTTTIEQSDLTSLLTFSPDGKVLALACVPGADRNDYPGTLRLLEVPTGRVLANLKGYKRMITCLCFSPKGGLLATGSSDGTVKVWKLPARYAPEK